ncbi:fructose-like specific PTS system EIIC component 2 [Escherichia coli]|nr:fructose-like specific PTS system EIIC component 2 [Escherichia coli]
MVPFLAAYIGYSIAERSALAPCAIGAWVGNSFGAGFFGALIAGIIGGIVVHYLKKIPVHKVLRSVMPIFIIPIVGTLITAGIMMWGLGEPVGALTNSLTQWLQGMQQGSIVMLAVIMGLMLAFDMGGPVKQSGLCLHADLRCSGCLYRGGYCRCWDLCSTAGHGAGDADWS